jgi:hypothetical protein
VKLAPSLALGLDFVFVFQPLALAEDLEAGAVNHLVDCTRSRGSGLCRRQRQSLAPARQGGEIRHGNIKPRQRRDTAHRPWVWRSASP